LDISELLPKALLSSRADVILAADRDGIIRFWSPGGKRMFGHSATEALGCSLDLIIPFGNVTGLGLGKQWRLAKAATRTATFFLSPALRNDGAMISVEFTIVPLKDKAGRMLGTAAIMRDVTKRFEELRALKRKLSSA
jgi:PAS domain S-box-containing protein